MRHLFSYLSRELGHPHPYTDALHRYSEQKQRRPATLSADFIQDLLEVTGNGRARDFEGARDHAMIRILTEGIRRGELLGLTMSALPDDLIRNPVIRVVPLKGARASGQGRLVLLTPSSARAFAVYQRVRRSRRFADSDWVWLGTRNRGQFSTTGIRKMLIRRAAEAGYGQVTPHQFRHTFSHDWQMGRIASGASFGRPGEHALPAPQRAALQCAPRAGASDGCGDQGLHGPPGSDATMMQLMTLR
jgi:integrase